MKGTFGQKVPRGLSKRGWFMSEMDDSVDWYERLLNQMNSIAFEEWHGHWQDGVFWIFDSDGNGIASGETVVKALAAFESLAGKEVLDEE